jgi:osmotically-inducible protein OsmY
MLAHIHASPADFGDDDLQRRTIAYLASRGFHSFRALRVSAEAGVIRITGRLKTWHEKQVARESCRRVAGVRQVVDAIEIAPSSFVEQSGSSPVSVA